MHKIEISTHNRVSMADITNDVQNLVDKSKISDGICVVFCPHTTAGLTINENADPDVQSDMIAVMNKLIPVDNGYAHCEGNSDSHVKASLFGPSISVIVHEGRLQLGTWQGIYLFEADGPRSRQVWVKIVKG